MLRGVSSYIVVLPSGRRIVMRYVTTDIYEAIDSSNFYLVTAGATATLFSPDGVQYRYTKPGPNGLYRCTKVVDRNGNCLTINYVNLGVAPNQQTSIGSIVDTLGRTITFNYDPNLKLLTITQVWAGQTFIWAEFQYGSLRMNTNFTPVNYGPPNGMVIPVITGVITGDGARHIFTYNSWGQANAIWTYGEINNQRASMAYAFPSTATAQNDCPRFTQRNDFIANWAGANNTGWVSTYLYVAPDESYGQIGLPNGVVYKEFHGNLNNEERGLLKRTETLDGSVRRKFTVYNWQSDGPVGVFPPIRPRLIETKVCDDINSNNTYQSGTDKMRRTTISYVTLPNVTNTTIRLPEYIREHNEGDTGSSAYRTRKLSYLSNTDYISSTRRIVGLVSQECLYSGDVGTLVAQTDYAYDCPADGFTYLQDHSTSTTAVSQHEGHSTMVAYQTGGQPRRGNLNKVLRWSVTSGTASAPITYKTGYNSTGTVACSTDGIDTHKTSVFYTDAFTEAVTGSPATPTYAYPTRVQDPDNFSSMVKYNYDHGGVTEAIDPKSYAANNANPQTKVVTLYDTKGRVERTKVVKDGADYSYSRNVYSNDHNWVQTRSGASGAAYEGRKDLGNVNKGDGVRFKGRGYAQMTGRGNYTKYSARIGVDMVTNPNLATDPWNAAYITVNAMNEGGFTGKGLKDYINYRGQDFVGARRIINGTDQANKIAGFANSYLSTLQSFLCF